MTTARVVQRSVGPRKAACFALLVVACSGPADGQVFAPVPPPFAGDAGSDVFPPVADALEIHCGTLDCHGSPARNFRLYGFDGQRLNPKDLTGDKATTDAEYIATYESLVAIQPEVLTAIFADRGAHPERWIVITKGRGTEHHKGGARMASGDDTDRCITSWLTGVLDKAACQNSSFVEPPGGTGF